jgi:hypothetical protein
MDKERILQTVLTLAVIGSLALVAGAIVTGNDSEWDSTQVASWRAQQQRANPPAERVVPPAPDTAAQPESASPPVAP